MPQYCKFGETSSYYENKWLHWFLYNNAFISLMIWQNIHEL
jgi:hypothetical protein